MRLFLSIILTFLGASIQAHALISVYVENAAFANDGYNFYTDSSKTTELNFFEGTDTLNVNETYQFFRLNDATAHPLYISDDQASAGNLTTGSGPTSDINLAGDGFYNSGIGANETLTLSFNSGFDTTNDKLYYYCTSHPTNMQAEFTVVPEVSQATLLLGGLAFFFAVCRRRSLSL